MLVSVKKPIAACGGGGGSFRKADTVLVRMPAPACRRAIALRDPCGCSILGSTTIAALLYKRRPGRTLQVNAFASSLLALGSSTISVRSFVVLPVLLPW